MKKKQAEETIKNTAKSTVKVAISEDNSTVTTTSTKSNKFFDTEEEKKIFIARLTAFILVGFIAPIVYLICRYNLFRPTNPGIAIGLWGCIVFGILIALVGVLVWYYLEAMKFKYTIVKQIVAGVIKIEMPLLLAIFLLTYFKQNLDLVIESLWVFFGTTMLAIIINPLPEFAFNHNIEGAGDIAKKIYDKVKPTNNKTTESTKENE